MLNCGVRLMDGIDCPVCLTDHDESIHAATVRLHAWWKGKLALLFVEPEAPVQSTRESWPGAGAKPRPEEARRPGGRVYGLSRPDVTLEAIRELKGQGMTRAQIAKSLGCSDHLITLRTRTEPVAEVKG